MLMSGPKFNVIITTCHNCLYFKEKSGELSPRCTLLEERGIKYYLKVDGGYTSTPDINCPFLNSNKLEFLQSEIEKTKNLEKEDLKIQEEINSIFTEFFNFRKLERGFVFNVKNKEKDKYESFKTKVFNYMIIISGYSSEYLEITMTGKEIFGE